jgi:hypothetical protein
MIASCVLAIAVIGVAGALAASYQASQFAQSSQITVSYARQLCEEIASVPFSVSGSNNPGWPANTNRLAYDTVDDFDGYSDSVYVDRATGVATIIPGNSEYPLLYEGAEDPPSPPASADCYMRHVRLEWLSTPTGAAVTGPTDTARLTVSVKPPKGPEVRVTRVTTRLRLAR